MKSNVNFSIIEIITAVLLFLLLRPSFTWTWNMTLIQYLFFLIVIVQFDFKERNNVFFLFIFLIIVCIVPIAHGQNIFGILVSAFLAFIPFVKKESMLKTFDILKYIVATVIAISIMVWFAVVIFQVYLPSRVIEPLNELKEYNYLSYPFLVIPLQIKDLELVRFCSVFDEPGVVGTLSLLFLYYGEFKMRRIENIVFFVGGLISFSLFFLLGFAIFVIIRIFLNKEMKKYRLASIVAIAAIFVAVLTVPVLNEMVGSRLEYDEDKGTIAGMNRSGEELDDYVVSIRGTSKYLWGDPKAEEDFANHASFQNGVLRYGVVFMILYFVFYFFYAKSRLRDNWRERLLFMLLLFLTLYQRPGFLSITYLYIFSSIIQSRQVVIESKRRKVFYEKAVLI